MLLPSLISFSKIEKKIPLSEALLPPRQKGNFHMDYLDAFLILIFLYVGILTRIIQIHFPSKDLFSEHFVVNFVNNYIKGEYFFDSSPPLGKLILTGIAYAGGYYGNYNFINQSNNSSSKASPLFFSIRISSAIFSSLCVPLLYTIMREAGINYLGASLTSIIIALDISLIVEGKFILTHGIRIHKKYSKGGRLFKYA